jgi:acetolactate decarboxylase
MGPTRLGFLTLTWAKRRLAAGGGVRARLALVAGALIAFAAGCAAPRNTVTQISTIDALLAGVYDGQVPCRKLAQYGDLGIGTFDRLDGELVLLDGRVFRVKADGKASPAETTATTPFAAVVRFQPQVIQRLVSGTTFSGFQEQVNALATNRNVFCAMRVKGKFRSVKTRSVPSQTKPYPPLVEVTRNQPVFDHADMEGTLLGFRLPDYVKGINVPGFHLHFLSADHEAGGHALDFTLDEGTIELAPCYQLQLLLPKDQSAFGQIDFSRDRSKELEQVE